jgi:HAD superfamily hydrolase (TIGR01549 family)
MTAPCEDPVSLANRVTEILPGKDPAMVREGVEEVWEAQLSCAREVEGATTLALSLRRLGFKLGVISNTWHPLFTAFLRTCPEMASLFDHVFPSYRMGDKKPSPALFQSAIKASGTPAGNCWMIGDAFELDIEPAQNAGMHAVWVLGRPERECGALVRLLRGEAPRPDWTVERLADVLPFFQEFPRP